MEAAVVPEFIGLLTPRVISNFLVWRVGVEGGAEFMEAMEVTYDLAYQPNDRIADSHEFSGAQAWRFD